MRFKEFFEEAKQVGDLYHFTNLKNFFDVIKSNKLMSSDLGISTTRNKFFLNRDRMGLGRDSGEKIIIGFILNGNKISNKYKIRPFNYFSFMKDKEFYESEEIIVVKDYLPLKPFLKGIVIKKNLITDEFEVLFKKKFTEKEVLSYISKFIKTGIEYV